ncbi:hypothetical protein ACTI_26760 [Actinoplanes sp. OR16]|uniref:hypothetical protein n=1 Tax=Actinoplanes sp. OR16 TaxID=946334 RepID=UPI000F6B53C5|nr:hypothetical protein [Actinoplanes sp. OR16]BBH65991.1 hypothetical protein ACTI_26760 [Actinoplanes sp. OR16]
MTQPPQSFYGPPPQPYYGPPPVAPPSAGWELERVDALGGTGFGLAQMRVVPITSGLAIGSLVAGIGSILVSVLALCFNAVGASDGWGVWVGGAFTLLSVLAGGGALAAGLTAQRQIRRSGQTGRVRFTGRGVAIAGICCGAAGAGIGLVGLLLGLVLQMS